MPPHANVCLWGRAAHGEAKVQVMHEDPSRCCHHVLQGPLTSSVEHGAAGGVHALDDEVVQHHLLLGPLQDVLLHAAARQQPAQPGARVDKESILKALKALPSALVGKDAQPGLRCCLGAFGPCHFASALMAWKVGPLGAEQLPSMVLDSTCIIRITSTLGEHICTHDMCNWLLMLVVVESVPRLRWPLTQPQP